MIPLRIINYDILTLEVFRGQYRSKTVKWENVARDVIICIQTHMIATRLIRSGASTLKFSILRHENKKSWTISGNDFNSFRKVYLTYTSNIS